MEFIFRLDEAFLLWIQENIRHDWMTPFWKLITSLGNSGWFWIALAVILLLFKRTRKAGAAALLALAIGALITNICLKNVVQRIRPYEVIGELTYLIKKPSGFSFPSGHSGASFAAATALVRYLPQCLPEKIGKAVGISAMVLAFLIAFSRMYLGVHYPTDILGGILAGVVSALLACRIIRRVYKEDAAPGKMPM